MELDNKLELQLEGIHSSYDGEEMRQQEGILTKGAQNSLYSGEEKRQLQHQESSISTVTSARSCGGREDSPIFVKKTAEKFRGRMPAGCGRRSICEGEESPVSVIYAASKHLMQLSHPSSACTSMEHPLHAILSPPPAGPFHFHNRVYNSQAEPYAAGSMSDRVQQAFSKSHELSSTKVSECSLDSNNFKSGTPQLYNNPNVKPWPNYTVQRRMEWLNLQEEPPLIRNAIPKVYVQSHTFASSPDEDDQASEEAFSIYSTRDQDEESVIDFFPSANRPSSAMQLRRRSYDRAVKGKNDKEKRVWLMSRRGSRGDDEEVEEEGTKRVSSSSSSSKWDDAERWLTSRAAPPLIITNDIHSTPAALHLVQATAQDKHVPENLHDPNRTVSGASHGGTGARRDAGTEMRLEGMRDMATQSTPADWSRCDSPETADAANFSTAAEKGATAHYSTGPEKGAPALKTSPPRHNTPARRSVSCSKHTATKQVFGCAPAQFGNGKLNLVELESCHLDKLKLAHDLPLGTSSTWQLYPDEDISLKLLEHKTPLYENAKSHQHAKVNMLEARVSAWEDVERAKHIAKFKREEAKIEAWESLQRAEADAELRKLEVKLEKLRFEGREKVMGRLGSAQRRAQEMRGAAEAHKVEQLTRVGMRANHIRKSGHLPSSTYNVVCSLTTKIKPTSSLSFA